MPSAQNKTQKQKHTHKIKRLNLSTGNKIYFCVLPDCSWKTKVALALGKQVICWRCEQPFYLNEYSIRLAKPHCENCHQSKNKDNFILPPNQTDQSDYAKLLKLPDDVKERLKSGSWDTSEPLTLAERLKKASQINHTILRDENEEEL